MRKAEDRVLWRNLGEAYDDEAHAMVTRMIPEPDTAVLKGYVSPKPSKISAHEFHKAIRSVLVCKGNQLSQSVSEEEMNRLLKEFAYRGCDIRYSTPQ